KYTGQGSGILCMAIVGGAIVPVATGFLADQIGLQQALMAVILCYAYIIYFGTTGYQLDHDKKRNTIL
ncbi:MAG: glucose/galactose MFS transporter, partial [Bacteroidia bacterium]|nr:glucose/galactose MFS transporter [Bacteroidia bacterium]